jgi:nicotinamide mononucleotide (NMN) deamidase PncC
MAEISRKETAIEIASTMIERAFGEMGDEKEAGGAWIALADEVDRQARARIEQLGGDAEKVRTTIDRYAMESPLR